MKTLLVILLALFLTLPVLAQETPQDKESTDKAFLFTLSGLDNLAADGYRGGLGIRYSVGNGYWLRGSFSYNGSLETEKAQASGGVFKDIWQTTNTTVSIGGELATTGVSGHQTFGLGASVLFMAWDNFGISLDEMILLHLTDDYVSTSSGGRLTLNIFF
jgi:hypothetical protein